MQLYDYIVKVFKYPEELYAFDVLRAHNTDELVKLIWNRGWILAEIVEMTSVPKRLV